MRATEHSAGRRGAGHTGAGWSRARRCGWCLALAAVASLSGLAAQPSEQRASRTDDKAKMRSGEEVNEDIAPSPLRPLAHSTNRKGTQADPPSAASKTMLHREGTKLKDEPGRFAMVGNRINFVTSAGIQYICLENLNLERVARIMGSTPDTVEWAISGTVTEYQGTNYLLIERSTRKLIAAQGRRGY